MALAAAGIGAAGSLLGGITGGKGAAKAAQIQAQSQAQALAEQQREYNQNQTNFAPYLQAGTSALGAQSNLLGLNGNDSQQAAVTALENSPMFTSLNQAGTDALLQSAAATGGLRGGNLQAALYNQRSQLLAQIVQNQLSNLGGMSSLGANSVNAAGQLGQSNTNAQSSIYQQQGNVGSSAALAGSAFTNETTNDITKILQDYLQRNTISRGNVQRLTPYAQANITANSSIF